LDEAFGRIDRSQLRSKTEINFQLTIFLCHLVWRFRQKTNRSFEKRSNWKNEMMLKKMAIPKTGTAIFDSLFAYKQLTTW